MNRKITREAVESLAPDTTIWDTEVRGFGARRQRRDAVYIVKYRDGEHKQRVITIGRHGAGEWMPDRARKEAIRLRGLARDGQDPAEKRDSAKSATTLAEFAARYMAEYAEPQKKQRSVIEDQRMLRVRILPMLGETKLREIARADVARLHAGMRAFPVSANRCLALLSAILGWAERVGERPDNSNPCRHVDRYPEKARERLMSAVEIGRLGEALERAERAWTDDDKEGWRQHCLAQADAEDVPAAARAAWVRGRMPVRETAEDWRAITAIRLLLFTGARVGEILTLRWEWIDPARGVARLPDSKTGRKNLYLAPGALAVLDVLPRMASNPHVLPGDKAGAHFIGLAKPWQRVRALAALSDVHLHDIRHAFASGAVAAGESLYLVGKVLGHRNASTTERYSHMAPDPVLAVAARTAGRLADLMGANRRGDDAKIIPLAASRV